MSDIAMSRRTFLGTASTVTAVAATATALQRSAAHADEAADEEIQGYPHTASQYVASYAACTNDLSEPEPIAAADVPA